MSFPAAIALDRVTKVTDEAIKELQKALPKCNIAK